MEQLSPAAEHAAARRQAVAIVLTRRVRDEDAHAFQAGLRELIRAAETQPGQLHAEVLRGARLDGSQDYHIAYRFEDGAITACVGSNTAAQHIGRQPKRARDRRRTQRADRTRGRV